LGHRDVCKHLCIIEVIFVPEETTPPDSDTTPEPTISLHALTGIQPRASRTMQHHIVIHGTSLTTLVDSGSTHNFINADMAARIGVALHA
jgi:hypothetical protein